MQKKILTPKELMATMAFARQAAEAARDKHGPFKMPAAGGAFEFMVWLYDERPDPWPADLPRRQTHEFEEIYHMWRRAIREEATQACEHRLLERNTNGEATWATCSTCGRRFTSLEDWFNA